MLVLTRRRNEAIVITTPGGKRIVVSVEDVRKDKVKLGITADPDVRIDRSEIDDATRRGAGVIDDLGVADRVPRRPPGGPLRRP